MILYEKEIAMPGIVGHHNLLKHFKELVKRELSSGETPIRFVVTKTDDDSYKCELGVLEYSKDIATSSPSDIFDFRKRGVEDTSKFNAVLLVPTGIGAEIGGHSGDAGPVARLLASVCDNLITHPNVVNASDINELPENGLYVEGSVISRLLMGTVALEKVRSNRVLLVVDKHADSYFWEAAVNSLSAARAAFGLNSPEIVAVEDNVLMRALYSNSGRAVGRVENLEKLLNVLVDYRNKYDAVALSSVINVPVNFHLDYFKDDEMLNPWGGVEAMLTHAISSILNVPSAHSPMNESREVMDLQVGIVDPRKSAEAISVTFLHCILKGLHRSPRIVTDSSLFNRQGIIDVSDISCLIIPDGCIGLPTLAALEQGIPVIAVKENRNRMQNSLEDLPFEEGKLIIVENYLEAVGVMNAIKSGVSLDSLRRPLQNTKITEILPVQDNAEEIVDEKPSGPYLGK